MPTTRESLEPLLGRLQPRHQEALRWFVKNAGSDQPWPAPRDDETLLVTKAKGIYKPAWTEYALSIRQTLGGKYPDKDPVQREDGTWLYEYFQENPDPDERDTEFTNKGLLACQRDRVPVGVMRQVRAKPDVRYRILGVALVAGWDQGYFQFEGFSPTGQSRGAGPSGQLEQIEKIAIDGASKDGSFDPSDVEDARTKTLAAIVRRRGQPAFRRQLLKLYESRCAVSGCDVKEALEAAHITPYRGPQTNHVANGLLLRADIHTLFDLGAIAIDERALRVVVAPELRDSVYGELHGRSLVLPEQAESAASRDALREHRIWAGLERVTGDGDVIE